MSNPFYGEAEVEVEGQTLKLVFNFSAMAAIEGKSDRSFKAIADELSPNADGSPKDLKISTAAMLLWGCLRAKHAALSFDEAGALLLGDGAAAVTDALTLCLSRAFPQPEEKANPPKRAKAGSGKNS